MPKATIRADWEPHKGGQREVLMDPSRFRIVACGRRWGKTEMCAREASRALGDPDTYCWWVAPTYNDADIGFDAVREALPSRVIEERKQSKPKGFTLVNGSEISFRSADREDSLRGVGVDLLVIDEAAMVPERAWTEELRPTLSDTQGEMVAISTPKGRGWFYEWFRHGDNEDRPDVNSWQYPTSENTHIPASEIEAAKRELPERVFEQEYLARFTEESGGVFAGLDETLFTGWFDTPIDASAATPPFSIGADLARHEDYRVVAVLDADGYLVAFDRARGETWPQIQRVISDHARRYQGIVSIDASRDNKLVADLEAEGLDIRPVKFSAQRKRELIENLVATVEAGELTAPAWDSHPLKTEMGVMEYEISRGGNVSYDAPTGFHDDTVDALALAADGLEEAARQSVSTTARVGGRGGDDTTGGNDLTRIAKEQAEKRGNPWK